MYPSRITLLGVFSIICFMLSGCNDDRPLFDTPFVYILDEYGGSTSEVNSLATFVATYTVYLSSHTPNRDIVVDYDIIVGKGLVENVDYRIIPSSTSPLIFPNGVYQMAIRIEWLRNPTDDSKENTLQVVLTETSDDITIGMPGKTKRFSSHTITKKRHE